MTAGAAGSGVNSWAFPSLIPFLALAWLGREAEATTGPAPILMATVPASLTLLATIPGQAVIGQAKSDDRLLLPHPAMETRQKWSRPESHVYPWATQKI